jgi:phage terminase large subunit GpA
MVMATSTITSRHQTHEDLLWFLSQSRPRRLRSMRQFAEEEIVIPSGPFIGRRFRCARQPYTGLWFDQIDSGRWSRCVATGPTQSGKSLTCFVIPMLYHLFEMGETVICGLPDMDMAADKWREDILPVIDQSRFRSLLPSAGGGSRGGRVESLQFANGATLKFMSGGGSDKSRAGFTSRVVVITETDGMDKAGGNSRESDKITQIEARTRAYGSRKRIYMECTPSLENGRTWQDLAGVQQGKQEPDCTALPGVFGVGDTGTGTPHRLAGSGEPACGKEHQRLWLSLLRCGLEQ